jgi:excisionase family DNA binding protein
MQPDRITINEFAGRTRDESAVSGSILDQLLTAEQMARLLQMRVSTIEDYARRGVLPSVKVGRHRRFLRSQVELTIAELAARRG